MRGRHLLSGGRLGVILVTLGGCAGPSDGGHLVRLMPSRHPIEPDIPLAEGFRLTDQSGVELADGSMRYVRHRYVGGADRQTTYKFYEEQMPLVRWTLTDRVWRSGLVTMRFERGAEACTIVIKERPSLLGRQVVVDLVIRPKPQGPSTGPSERRNTNYESRATSRASRE